MKNSNHIKKIVYRNEQKFLEDYFNNLNNINDNYCKYLVKKKYLKKEEFIKIIKTSKILKKNKFKALIKSVYERGYYFEYENFFKKKIGENISGKMHIGRSRNDLDSTIAKLILKKNVHDNISKKIFILKKINNKFSNNKTLFPYFTQNQFASFLTVRHYFISNIYSLINFTNKIISGINFLNECPLGACGLNGSSININYHDISKKLGFKFIQKNSHRSVSEYEYYLSFINDFNLSVIKWSRIFNDLQILHNENNQIIKFNKNFYGKSSFFPHKENAYLIEFVLSQSNDLCNYSNNLTNLLRKSINSNSFEIKSIIKLGYEFFGKYNEFLELINFVTSNLEFNKVNIFEKKYEKLFLTFLQNYIIKKNKNVDARKLNDKIHKLYKTQYSLDEVINILKKDFPNTFFFKESIKNKNFLIKENKFGSSSQDPKALTYKILKKKILVLEKKLKLFK